MMQKMKLSVIVVMLAMTSACGQPESPATASDTAKTNLCLIDKPIMFDPAPSSNASDPNNEFDTEDTVAELLAHNARYRRICPDPQ